MRLCAVAGLAVIITGRGLAGDRQYLEAAQRTARWLETTSISTPHGKTWAANPLDTGSISADLYGGSAGVVLFFLEAFHATRDSSYLAEGTAGADYLLDVISDDSKTKELDAGFYSGLAGLGYVLEETYKVSGKVKYREGTRRCVELIKSRSQPSGGGVAWMNRQNDTTYFVTDIIGGSSGTGLFLLYAARELQDSACRNLAIAVGHRLIEAGVHGENGVHWAMDAIEPGLEPIFPRLMPNFSHGTAGVAYFLATLYRETKREEFLEAALNAAYYLLGIAKQDSATALIFHHEPDGKDLFYLGWCHGPAGTSRLFYRLFQVTGDSAWLVILKKFAAAELQSGIPEHETPGFWNNVSQCCGSAGVAEYFLELYRLMKDPAYLEIAKRLTQNLLARSTSDDSGERWAQAEHRVKPELLVAQTGYMQGAAGIGIWLLHLDAFERGANGLIMLPDSPF